MGAALKARQAGDKKTFDAQLDSFAILDPAAWLAQTFGAKKGASLVQPYNTSLGKFKSHISFVSENWAVLPRAALAVETSQQPFPVEGSGDVAGPPRPLALLRIENFRFTVMGEGRDPTSWVFSFVYLDGKFRIVGGTCTFWDEPVRIALSQGALPTRIRMGGNLQAAALIHMVQPKYPKSAKKDHIQGTVVLHAIIGKDGTIQQLEAVSGPLELIPYTLEAVKHWVYKPTLLQGQPVEVDTQSSVVFTLGH